MEIRLANVNDIPGMIRLLRQVGQVHRDIRPDIFRPGVQKYNEAELAQLLADTQRPVFVAVEGDKFLGYCFCIHQNYLGGTVMTDRKELYIDDLCVEETARGMGVATRLYHHVLDYARERGCAFVTLNVWCGNSGAMAFYEKMGLTPRSITLEKAL